MKSFSVLIAILSGVIGCGVLVFADEDAETQEEDSSAGLPEQYAKDYLVAGTTVSPDKKFAVIYPTLEAEEAAEDANQPGRIKDYVVALHPFAVLGELQTKFPYFQNENHGGISAQWSNDSSVALVTLGGKWGPHDVFLLEFRDGTLTRTTNILAKAHDLLLPDFRKSKAEPYNDVFDFVFDDEDGPVFKLDGSNSVVIDGDAVTDPKGISKHRWSAHLEAVWEVPEGKFGSQKITRLTRKQNK
ncbi:MAG TPA: hypothetical protein VFA51_11070 [Candidatus Udaeobacter sp.]|nr:hypothetical protein [Candidatus Udaeobacter sp.]